MNDKPLLRVYTKVGKKLNQLPGETTMSDSSIQNTNILNVNKVYLKISYLLIMILMAPYLGEVIFGRNFPVDLLFDDWDVGVYFNSSSWIFGAGKLYTDIPSELKDQAEKYRKFRPP